MKRGKRPGKYRRRYPVPTAAIHREIRKAQKKLHAKRRKASTAKQKDIDLQMKVLRSCDVLLEDILCL
jgi:hypothetical protein